MSSQISGYDTKVCFIKQHYEKLEMFPVYLGTLCLLKILRFVPDKSSNWRKFQTSGL